MVSAAKVKDIQKRIEVCREYAALWEDFFKTFGTSDFPTRKIFDSDEQAFLQILTQLAMKRFRFCYYMGDTFGSGEQILDVLTQAQGLRHIQEMPEANFSKLEIDWHTIFIEMHRALGRLLRQLPSEKPEQAEAKPAKAKHRLGFKPAKKAAPPSTPKISIPKAEGGLPRPGAAPPKLAPPKPKGPPRPKGP